jgi:hypothetical protein
MDADAHRGPPAPDRQASCHNSHRCGMSNCGAWAPLTSRAEREAHRLSARGRTAPRPVGKEASCREHPGNP